MEYSTIWSRNMDDTQSRKNKDGAFETWRWRRTLKIPWTDRVKNEEVFQK